MAKQPFAQVDKESWKPLWQWANRRHPTKGRRWIKNRYFRSNGNRHWEFAAESTSPDGEQRITTLLKASDTKIHRHVQIRGEANPFDPKQEAYFEDRLGQKMKDSLSGKGQLLRLWWSQDKTCPLCRQQITKETRWNIHHLIPREDGGKDNLANLVLVHPNGHRQLHCQKLEVVKPAPARGLCRGLSRMKGNFHVRFLGEEATVTSLPYPTQYLERFSVAFIQEWAGVPLATCSPVLGKGTGRQAARGTLLHDLAKLICNLL